MSDHEFERQVRQKLNDLKITPSAGAWENIEEKLHERKRRPVIFYWMPLLLAGLGAAGYFMFDSLNEKSTLSHKNSTYVTTTPGTSAHSNESAKANESANPKKSANADKNVNDLSRSQNTDAPDVAAGNVEPVSTQTGAIKSQTKIARYNRHTNDRVEVTSHQAPSINTTGKKVSGNATALAEDQIAHIPGDGSPSLKNTTPVSDAGFRERFLAPSESITLKNVNRFSSSPLQQKKANVSSSNKWEYGLTGFAGVSAVNEGNFLNFSKPEVEDVSTVAPFAPLPPYKPSTISPGFSFSAGAFVKRDLNKKFSLSLGLNYLQVNTRNKVGSEVYGNYVVNNGTRGYIFVSNYFMVDRDQQTDYRNRYHFIEVPLELHARINKNEKLPIRANAGIAVSQLLKSNSLHFDGTSGVYYRNDKLLNQTQFAVRTGVAVELFNKTTRPIWIGPSARYNVSRVLQKDVSANKNFMSLGLDVKMFIR